MDMSEHRTDPLRRLLDAVLDEESRTLSQMAGLAYTSPFHLSRTVSARSGEAPVALRRRVTLEQAAWRLQRGAAVTETAFASGYDSLEGFTRAFRKAYGHPPTAMPPHGERGHWLPAPNGIHFHSPTALYVDAGQSREQSSGNVLALMVQHDLDDIALLLDATAEIPADRYRHVRMARHSPRGWDGADESLAQVMRHLVLSKEPWLASIAGEAEPDLSGPDDPAALADRHEVTAPRWLALVRDIDRRDAWQDRIVDALCDPPESFLLSQILAHELTYSTHRRLLARWMLSDAGIDTTHLDPDPILWHRRRTGDLS